MIEIKQEQDAGYYGEAMFQLVDELGRYFCRVDRDGLPLWNENRGLIFHEDEAKIICALINRLERFGGG